MITTFIKLKDFLERNGTSTEEFFKEARETCGYTKEEVLVILSRNPESVIDVCLHWCKTRRGGYFWSRLDDKWGDLIAQNE